MARMEARHAGFLNKSMVIGPAARPGLLTANKAYTLLPPKFIFYPLLSENDRYWRYIAIYRHLQQHPESKIFTLDLQLLRELVAGTENRHGDFLVP